MRGIAVVPAAELPPQVAHHELRLVVHGFQIRLVEHGLIHLHGMHDVVQLGALIHHGEGLRHDALQRLGHFREHPADALRPRDGQAVRGQKQLRPLCRHRPQRLRPFAGITLRLLRIAGVGEVPDEEVPGANRFVLRNPSPSVVVRFAAAVRQPRRQTAHVDVQRFPIRGVWVWRGVRQERAAGGHGVAVAGELPELPLVDDAVVAIREPIALEAVRHVLMPDDARPRMAVGVRVRDEGAGAAGVIHVPVGIDDGVEAPRPPLADGVHHPGAAVHAAGVEGQQAVVRLEQHAVGERLHHRDAIGDGRQLMVDAVDGADVLNALAFVDDGVGEGQQVCHGCLWWPNGFILPSNP